MPRALPGRAVALAAAAVAAAALAVPLPSSAAPAGGAPAALRLPDLDQEIPSQLDVAAHGRAGHRSYRLGFGSGVRNVGTGPLVIDGNRAAGSKAMSGDQLIDQDGGAPPVRVPGAGRMRYVRAADHQHWHLLGFDRYELRRAGGTRAIVRDRKSGFCLGDRYRVTTRSVPGAGPQPTYTSRCGLTHPELLHVVEGISVGYGDFYAGHIEYQDLPIDGLRDGRYVLVHRVNADRRLRESSYTNNAASVLLGLRWASGVPHLSVLAVCPDSARCEKPAGGAAASTSRLPRVRAQTPTTARGMLCSLQGTARPPARWGGVSSVGP